MATSSRPAAKHVSLSDQSGFRKGYQIPKPQRQSYTTLPHRLDHLRELDEERKRICEERNYHPKVIHASHSKPEITDPSLLATVTACQGCHLEGSGRRLLLPKNPSEALWALREAVASRTSAANLETIYKMASKSVFAGRAKEDQEKLMTFLLGGDPGSTKSDSIDQAVKADLGESHGNHQSLLRPDWETFYRSLVKDSTDNPFVNAIVSDPDTQFFDKTVMPDEYQVAADGVGFGQNRDLLTSRRSRSFNGIVGPNGKLRGALGRSVGVADDGPLKTFTFLRLPKDASQKELDIAYAYMNYGVNGSQAGLSYLDFWKFPIGTQLGEVIYAQDPVTKRHYVAEIRTERRMPGGGWIPDAYRRFPTAESLIARVKSAFPDSWETPGSRLNNLVKHLEDKSRLKEVAISDDYFTKILQGRGAVDKLPPISPDEASQLIAGVPLKSSLHEVWDENEAGAKSYAPTAMGFHAVPPMDNLHAIPVTTEGCTQCHRMTGTNVGLLRPNEVNSLTDSQTPETYLSTWGANGCEDGAPSFNPYRLDRSGNNFPQPNTDKRRFYQQPIANSPPDWKREFWGFMKLHEPGRPKILSVNLIGPNPDNFVVILFIETTRLFSERGRENVWGRRNRSRVSPFRS